MWKQVLRGCFEVAGTMALAETVVDMSYERHPEVTFEDQAQFVNNVTEYNILKNAIHNGMINHVRHQVLPMKNGKFSNIPSDSIEELFRDLLPEDLEDPVKTYQDKSTWFETLRMLHDERNIRQFSRDLECFTVQEKQLMSSFPPVSAAKKDKSQEDILQLLLSTYALERTKRLELHKQVDHNFCLLEKEMNRELDAEDAELFPLDMRFFISGLVLLAARLMFIGTKRLSQGANDLLLLTEIVRKRPNPFSLLLSGVALGTFVSLTKPLRDRIARDTGSDSTSLIEEGFLSNLFEFSKDPSPTATDVDDDGNSILMIQKSVDVTRNERQIWVGDSSTDPYSLGRRIYYHVVVPGTQVLLFNHLLLRSLAQYMPSPVAHIATALSFVAHSSSTVTPLYHDKSMYEQGMLSAFQTLCLQAWSAFANYPSNFLYILGINFYAFSSWPDNNDQQPELTSYMLENTERFSLLVNAFAFFIRASVFDWGSALGLSAPKNDGMILTHTTGDDLIKLFSSDYFTVDIHSKKLFQRDIVDLWLAWEKYLRHKQQQQQPSASQTGPIESNFVMLSKHAMQTLFPEVMKHYAGKDTKVEEMTKEEKEKREIVQSMLDAMKMAVMEHVFPEPGQEISQDLFFQFVGALFSKAYNPKNEAINLQEFIEFVRTSRHEGTAEGYPEEEILDLLQVTQENLWKADCLLLNHYESYLFRDVEQQLAGRVHRPEVIAQGAKTIETYLKVLDRRLSRQLQWQMGMSVEKIRFVLKTHAMKYPASMTQLQKEWRVFYSGPEFIAQRMKNIHDLETNQLKRRLYGKWIHMRPKNSNATNEDNKK